MAIGRAFTVQFQPKDTSISFYAEPRQDRNVESGVQWSDLAEDCSVVAIQQPEGQRSAVAGGMHMTRLCTKGVKGLVVGSNIRDQRELASLPLPVGHLC